VEIKSLFKESYPKFYRYAYSLTKDKSSAEDLVMDVFQKLIEREKSIPKDVNIEAYTMRSIKNQFYDMLKKEKTMNQFVVATNEEQLADKSSSPQVSEKNNLDTLIQNLETLGENCKNVLSLFGLGHSYKEIAEIEDISAGTVMSRMARCREKLRVIYQE
jgi:RNA polymerase sigma-70 factor, ECF subfamily